MDGRKKKNKDWIGLEGWKDGQKDQVMATRHGLVSFVYLTQVPLQLQLP